MERYEILKDIGSGNFAVAKLVRDIFTKEFFAVKFIERGHKVCFLLHFLHPFSVLVSFFLFLSLLVFLNLGSAMFCVLCVCVCALQIDEHVQREIMNHRSLKHPNIIRFKEVSELKVPMSKGCPILPRIRTWLLFLATQYKIQQDDIRFWYSCYFCCLGLIQCLIDWEMFFPLTRLSGPADTNTSSHSNGVCCRRRTL